MDQYMRHLVLMSQWISVKNNWITVQIYTFRTSVTPFYVGKNPQLVLYWGSLYRSFTNRGGQKLYITIRWMTSDIRPTFERRSTLGRLRSINPDMINYFTSQSPANFLKIKTHNGPDRHHRPAISASPCAGFRCRMEMISIFFYIILKGNCEKWCNLMLNWRGSTSILKLTFFKC